MAKEPPLHHKVAIAQEISEILKDLQTNQLSSLRKRLDTIKEHAHLLDLQIQKDVLDFIQQVEFESDYDPQHLVTKEIIQAAENLIKDLGFHPPK